MQVSVTGKQIDVGDSLRSHAEQAIAAIVEKYFDRAIEAHVVIGRERHAIRADISVHAIRGLVVQSASEANDPYVAFDSAAERLDKQLRRYKRRLRNHHARAKEAAEETEAATDYVLAPEAEDDGAHEAEQPLVVAEMRTTVPRLSVREAVMRLDLADAPALLFRNSAHGNLNMIYRRHDGNIGWIDPDFANNDNGTALKRD